MSILSVSNLTTSFRRNGVWNAVVNDVSLTVNAGETVAIVGESGSGKSVTAMSIMRLLPERTSRVTETSGWREPICCRSANTRCRTSAATGSP